MKLNLVDHSAPQNKPKNFNETKIVSPYFSCKTFHVQKNFGSVIDRETLLKTRNPLKFSKSRIDKQRSEMNQFGAGNLGFDDIQISDQKKIEPLVTGGRHKHSDVYHLS